MSLSQADDMTRASPEASAERNGFRLASMPAFFRMRDVLRITALSRPTLYRRIAAQKFPPPVHLGGRACGWSAVALQSWIDNPDDYRAPSASDTTVPRKRGRPRKYAAAS